MKKILITLFALTLCLPGFIFSDLATFKVSYFIPLAMSDLWEDEFTNMSFTKSEFQNTNFAFGYEYFVSREFSIILSFDNYTKNKSGIYNDYVGAELDGDDFAFDYGEGFPITHLFSVTSTPIQASIKLTPLGRKGKIIPYIGGGVGAYLWTVRLQGDMVDFSAGEEFQEEGYDFSTVIYPVYSVDAREENKIGFGFHAFGGAMFPIANRISLEAEVKYNQMKGTLKDSFIGWEPFDLSGLTISLGMNYWF